MRQDMMGVVLIVAAACSIGLIYGVSDAIFSFGLNQSPLIAGLLFTAGSLVVTSPLLVVIAFLLWSKR